VTIQRTKTLVLLMKVCAVRQQQPAAAAATPELDLRHSADAQEDVEVHHTITDSVDMRPRWQSNHGADVARETKPRNTTTVAGVERQITTSERAVARQGKSLTALQRITEDSKFDIAMGVVIMANAIQIGVESSLARHGIYNPMFRVLDTTFLFMYILELMLRFTAHGIFRALNNSWVRFDACLVLFGSVDFVAFLTTSNSGQLKQLLLFRILRCAKIVRVFRLMANFRVLWLLTQGLLHSIPTLLWTFVIISLLIYMYSILAMELIQPDTRLGASYNDVVEEQFSSLPYCALTLLQGLTLDSVGSIYRPLILGKPVLVLYFLSFIFLVSIALMNLVTAIMVESSLRQAEDDREAKLVADLEQRSKLIENLRRTFMDLDSDESGTLSLQELLQASTEVKEALSQVVNMHDLSEIFCALDFDGSGKIDISEFVVGLLEAQKGKPLEMYVILRQCSHLIEVQRKMDGKVNKLAARQGELENGSVTALTKCSGLHKSEAPEGKLVIL